MPKIKRELYKRTELYQQAVAEGAALHEFNDCFPRAVWLATNQSVSYAEVIAMFAHEGRKARRGTFNMQAREVLKQLGCTPVEMGYYGANILAPKVPTIISEFMSRYPAGHREKLKSVTTHHPDRFHSVWADGWNYIFLTRGHAAAVINGVLHDHNRGRARRVYQIWRIARTNNRTGEVK